MVWQKTDLQRFGEISASVLHKKITLGLLLLAILVNFRTGTMSLKFIITTRQHNKSMNNN
jgi:Na+/H+ antiporter NhaC